MLRTILLLIDDSPAGTSAAELGFQWARKHGALLVGLGVIDQPMAAAPEPVPLGGGAYRAQAVAARLHAARQRVERALSRFAVACSEAQLPCKPLEDVGELGEELLREAQRYDLILVGRPTDHEAQAQLARWLKAAPRPVVAVAATAQTGQNVLVAYDGSVQAARTLQAYVASGLAGSERVHVLTVHDDRVEAARRAERAVEYLAFHGIAAERQVRATSGPVADALLEAAQSLDAGLVVMGACGQPAVKEFVFGSVTRRLLSDGPWPLFLYH
jgi:nucleotide-binding universal stress UspA family protein